MGMPEIGAELKKGSVLGTIESVKAASDLYAPVTGTVTAVNQELPTKLELFKADAYGRGWMVKINVADSSELQSLMSAADYEGYLKTQE